MGHLRVGTLPDTAPWRRVVAAVAGGESAAAVAAAASKAAVAGLETAHRDDGLRHSVYFLAKAVQAARDGDFAGSLRAAGLPVPDGPGVFDVAAALTAAVDRQLRAGGRRTDVGEMARLAAAESLTRVLGERVAGLFEADPADVHRAARSLSTESGFADLYHDFFGRFARRFLEYHLDRELPLHVGCNGRFADPRALNEFGRDLDLHCRQAALIVKDFAGGWLDKNRRGGPTPKQAGRFADHCLTKLRAELLVRGGRGGA